jgi:glutamate formiminotransferase
MNIFESVPNFSTSDENIIEILKGIITSGGSTFLDSTSDRDHNRSVITLIADNDRIVQILFDLAKSAKELIDMEKHRGLHPRIGALDVLPIVPMGNSTMNEAIEISNKLGYRIGSELGIPVYMYGESAKIPERRDISYIRNMHFQYEELKQHILEEKYKPDYGPAVLGSAGAMMVGARNFLIAYNVNINTDDVSKVNMIVKKIRSGKYFKGVKALAFPIKSKGYTQLSMNIYCYKCSPINNIYNFIDSEAKGMGFDIESSEIIGLLPADAVALSLGKFIKADISGKNILEYKILGSYGNR